MPPFQEVCDFLSEGDALLGCVSVVAVEVAPFAHVLHGVRSVVLPGPSDCSTYILKGVHHTSNVDVEAVVGDVRVFDPLVPVNIVSIIILIDILYLVLAIVWWLSPVVAPWDVGLSVAGA